MQAKPGLKAAICVMMMMITLYNTLFGHFTAVLGIKLQLLCYITPGSTVTCEIMGDQRTTRFAFPGPHGPCARSLCPRPTPKA